MAVNIKDALSMLRLTLSLLLSSHRLAKSNNCTIRKLGKSTKRAMVAKRISPMLAT
jgi:hypothetical protein